MPLKPLRHIETAGETGGFGGTRGRQAAHAAAAEKIEFLAGRETGIAQLADEIGVHIATREILPGDQNGLLARRAQIGDADILPFGIRAHVDQLRVGIGEKGFPSLFGGYIGYHVRHSFGGVSTMKGAPG